MGITGLDIIEESQAEVEVLQKLNMGKCALAVQAPVGKFKSVEELAGKRIVTSFPNVAREFFKKLEKPGDKPTDIKYDQQKQNTFTRPCTVLLMLCCEFRFVSGSVEVACALGLADGIVDLVETGTTMRAAGLEMVSTFIHLSAP